ncbi:MAG: peptidoglycan DD-metalloendopeptidase family protein [Sterolibacteriaceae bacterium MAG5]|nr:peptidoglycan DD-metalloendopeptidase family protein [Candidatus Nitricoxidireducens bremensis]
MKSRVLLTALLLIGLAGCASHAPVPVVERGAPAPAPAPVSKPAIQVPPAGETRLHTVKKGETLYSISLEHGQDYKDVAAWNNIENPNRIQVGQQLKVSPPEGPAPVAVVKPVTSSGPVEAKPLVSGSNSEAYKREPKGGKLAYSEQALARMRSQEQAPEAVRQVDQPVEKPAEKPAVPAPTGDDAIDWAWPSNGRMLSNFVEGGAGKESNKGIDIAGRTGEAVLAAATGKVVYVGSGLRGYGNLVIVRHNPSYLSAYAHNSKILVKEGQAVNKGQKIAEIGSSDADQPKLHFEIRRLGKPVDPIPYLPAR